MNAHDKYRALRDGGKAEKRVAHLGPLETRHEIYNDGIEVACLRRKPLEKVLRSMGLETIRY